MTIEKSLRLRSDAAARYARNSLLLAVVVSISIVILLPLICSGLPEAFQEFKNSRQLTVVASGILLRGAGLFVAIYVVTILVQVSKFHFETSSRHELLADAMCLAGESTEEFRVLVGALEPKTISFEKESSIKLTHLVSALRKEFNLPGTADK